MTQHLFFFYDKTIHCRRQTFFTTCYTPPCLRMLRETIAHARITMTHRAVDSRRFEFAATQNLVGTINKFGGNFN